MKKTISILKAVMFLLILGGLILSCDIKIEDNKNGTGTLLITLPGSGSARAAENVDDDYAASLRYQIECIGIGIPTSGVFGAGSTIPILLSAGPWNISVTALNKDGKAVGYGSEAVFVMAGMVSSTSINVRLTNSGNDIIDFIVEAGGVKHILIGDSYITVIVDEETSSITFKANDGIKDSKTFYEKNTLSLGMHEDIITVTAGSGHTKSYTVYVYKYGKAVAKKVSDFGEDFKNVNDPRWEITPPLFIDRFFELNSSGYVKAPPVPINVVNGTQGVARILWDNDYLYFKVDVENAEMRSNYVPPAVHDQDSVEIFINEDITTGYQYRVDFKGNTSFGKYLSPNYDKNFIPSAGFYSGVYNVYGSSYTVIARIPIINNSVVSGRLIGVDLQINGAPKTGNGVRKSVAVWLNEEANSWDHPNKYKETLTLIE